MTSPSTDLRLQLLPIELIAQDAPDALRDAGGGLVSRLVSRTDTGIVPISREQAAAQQETDLFAVAAEQTYRQELAAADVRDHTAASVSFRMVAIDGNPFVTTALLWADTTAGFPGMTDALVCAPRLSAVLVRPVTARSDIGMATTMASVARMLIDDAPDPCSPAVFWWHRGRFHAIGFDAGDPQPILSAELGPIIEALPE